ncbi:thioredoxin reductase GliT [Apiospora aurea]|uniref:Thioredoxin reductase GliT n=1 Tax=Apiospora aurea TaxID=335848 RepID=A0ABR1QNB7_9PEZI
MDFTDVAIIGGGPAGLTAANMVARQLHTAVVYDSGAYRNEGAAHFHMVLTWDHKNPADYRRAARENILANYSTVEFASLPVAKIDKKSDARFEVHDGKADRGGASSGVLAVGSVGGAMAAHMAQNAAQLTDKVALYTNGDDVMTAEVTTAASLLIQSKFNVETRKIKQLTGNDADNSVTVEFEDGTTKVEKFLVHNPETTAQGPFVDQLGLETTVAGDIKADYPFWGTNVPGVYAVGDCSTPYKMTPSAITSGCNAAVAIISFYI